ncbi:MFS transporter [Sphingomonas leidyi]|jgi:ACS family hexuronate transporter-like MFS transporter|uniref:MFS transporter n=1 Tax=Sphingomonas TaxID=13687 RepID=UPI0009A20512
MSLSASQEGQPPAPTTSGQGTPYRWRICALIFVATTINYADRQLLGILKPILDTEIGWSEREYGYVVLAFQAAYAIGLTGSGWLLDRIGARRGYALATGIWSLAIAAHAVSSSFIGFVAARFALGVSEAGNYPAAIKSVAEHFPQHQRATATGLFNAGSNVGAMLAPLLVPLVLAALDWRWAFLFAAIPGLIWVVAWLLLTPREHRPERAAMRRATPLRHLVRTRGLWAYAIAKFLTDPVWWFFLFWLPDFLNKSHGLQVSQLGLPLLTVYLLADVGSVAGGWSSSALIQRGVSVNKSRKFVMLTCAILILPVAWAPSLQGLWPTVFLVSLAVAGHQAWSANLLTLVSDQFPAEEAASVAGFGGTIGAVGGMAMAWMVGHWLDAESGYSAIFLAAAGAYLVAFAVIHLLVPVIGGQEHRSASPLA